MYDAQILTVVNKQNTSEFQTIIELRIFDQYLETCEVFEFLRLKIEATRKKHLGEVWRAKLN